MCLNERETSVGLRRHSAVTAHAVRPLTENPYKGTPSLAGRSLLKNSPPDCFEIHLLRSAFGEFRRLKSRMRRPKALPLGSGKGDPPLQPIISAVSEYV